MLVSVKEFVNQDMASIPASRDLELGMDERPGLFGDAIAS